MTLTRSQHRVYTAIKTFISERGYSPSFDELGIIVGCRSGATIWKHVDALERQGYIRRNARGRLMRMRCIEIVPEAMRSMKSCQDGHDLVFYECAQCPVCKALDNARLTD